MYINKFNRKWNPCDICKWNVNDENEIINHCNNCNELASEWEESNEFKQFKVGVSLGKIGKQIEESREKFIKYPTIILCTDIIKDKLLNIDKEKAYKKGIEIIEIKTIDDLIKYIDKFFSYISKILIVPSTNEFRDFIYKSNKIMSNWKVFNVFPELNNSYLFSQDPLNAYYLQEKKFKNDIISLKLDKRFDQIPIDNINKNLFEFF